MGVDPHTRTMCIVLLAGPAPQTGNCGAKVGQSKRPGTKPPMPWLHTVCFRDQAVSMTIVPDKVARAHGLTRARELWSARFWKAMQRFRFFHCRDYIEALAKRLLNSLTLTGAQIMATIGGVRVEKYLTRMRELEVIGM